LLGISPSTAKAYLGGLKAPGYANYFYADKHTYWHILPRGIRYLSEVLGFRLPLKFGTVSQKATRKRGLRHDALCTEVVMRFIETSSDERGLFLWYGPILTRTLYKKAEKTGEMWYDH